jgi:hypothetical protein
VDLIEAGLLRLILSTRLTYGTGWPLVADLSRRPIVNGVINSKPSAKDLCTEFLAAVKLDMTSATHDLARSLHELSDRLRQKDAERERVGLTRSDSRLQSAYGVMHGIELKIDELAPARTLAWNAGRRVNFSQQWHEGRLEPVAAREPIFAARSTRPHRRIA